MASMERRDPEKIISGIASKMALAKDRLASEVQSLGSLIDREILNAGEWPPAPEISVDIKRRSMGLGARAVKLLDAVDKLETARALFEDENENLSNQLHEIRMKSSGISPAELAHLRMENKVLKDHVNELETAFAGEGSETTALQAKNAGLHAKLKELEEELNRLLGTSTEASEIHERNEALVKQVDDLEKDLVKAREALAGADPETGVLARIWSEPGEEEAGENERIAGLQERIDALELENERLMERGRKKLEEVKRQRDDLAQKVVDLASTSAERAEHAIEEIVVLQKERDRLKEELDGKDEELKKLRG